MGKIFFLFIVLFIGFQSFGQDTLKKRVVKKFIPLKQYESSFGKVSDTTEFMYKDTDTLVSVPLDFDPYEGKDLV